MWHRCYTLPHEVLALPPGPRAFLFGSMIVRLEQEDDERERMREIAIARANAERARANR